MTRRFVVEADGGSRGNPGPAGYGALVRDAGSGELLAEVAEGIGLASNNVAEYGGLVAGLTAAVGLDPDCTIEVRMDSKLVVEQMSGRWQIKHPDMRRLAARARSVVDPQQVKYTWIPRERNAAADRLANQAMDDAERGRPWRGPSTGPAPPAEDRPGAARVVAPGVRPAADAGPGTRLVLLRHGVTAHTVERRFSGQGGDDLPLTELGRRQADAAGLALAASGPFDAVVCSPLLRTRQTAELVAARLGLDTVADVRVDEAWVECGFGAWDGRTMAEVAERWPAEHTAWLASTAVAPPGGESLDALDARVLRARDRAIARHPHRRVLVVTHVSPIKAMTRTALGAGLDAVWRMQSSPASINQTCWWSDGGAALLSFNDTAHLHAAGIPLR